MRVVFCGGGTGGHVYPALTVASALRDSMPGGELDMLYVGVKGKIDAELVAREGIDFKAVDARPLRTGRVRGTARGALTLAQGTAEAQGFLRKFRPDVVFATGGYGSVGVGLAARLLRTPLLVFLPDVEAGLAVKALVKVADRVAVTVQPALEAMPAGKAVLTGYPVRPQFFGIDRAQARERLGLERDLPALLVSGASSGANRINRAVWAMTPEFLRTAQIVHLCGSADEAWLRAEAQKLPADLRARYHLHSYLHEEMALAMGAADIAVMRSGASTLGELPATRLPAVLVPGEYEGWDQSPNARYLEGEGAAIMLPQARLEADLRLTVTGLLADTERRDRMRAVLGRLARPDAAANLARLLEEMAGVRPEIEVAT
jgi:UDP-N-acetylglucosamine--N-acetylmuramyl-(pentapeptide) pyrophosphoryl-undecaprenol N-acetylglucosamine transferase